MPEPIQLPNGVTVIGKPFPRTCARCGTKTVWPVTIPYLSMLRYEGKLEAVEVPNLVVPRCESCGELHFDNYTDDQINQSFRAQVPLLTPEQLRGNRSALGLSQEELASRLGVTEDLVRRWEEDLLLPSRSQDKLMRLFFALPQVRSVLSEIGAGQSLGTAVGR